MLHTPVTAASGLLAPWVQMSAYYPPGICKKEMYGQFSMWHLKPPGEFMLIVTYCSWTNSGTNHGKQTKSRQEKDNRCSKFSLHSFFLQNFNTAIVCN